MLVLLISRDVWCETWTTIRLKELGCSICWDTVIFANASEYNGVRKWKSIMFGIFTARVQAVPPPLQLADSQSSLSTRRAVTRFWTSSSSSDKPDGTRMYVFRLYRDNSIFDCPFCEFARLSFACVGDKHDYSVRMKWILQLHLRTAFIRLSSYCVVS